MLKYYQQIIVERTPEAQKVEILKANNLSCAKCPNYKRIQTHQGTCALKRNKIVKQYNICENYGKVLIC